MATISDFRQLVPVPSVLNDGLRKARLLPTLESLRLSEKFLVSRLSCKIQIGRGIFSHKVGWNNYDVALSPTDRVLIFYISNNTGNIIPIDDAYKFRIFNNKSNLLTSNDYTTIIKLKYDFGVIKVKIPKDENLQLWLSMFISAHYPQQSVDFSSIFEKISHKDATTVSIKRIYNNNELNFSINVQRKLKWYDFRHSIDKCRENALPPVEEHHHEHYYFFIFDRKNKMKLTTIKPETDEDQKEKMINEDDFYEI